MPIRLAPLSTKSNHSLPDNIASSGCEHFSIPKAILIDYNFNLKNNSPARIASSGHELHRDISLATKYEVFNYSLNVLSNYMIDCDYSTISSSCRLLNLYILFEILFLELYVNDLSYNDHRSQIIPIDAVSSDCELRRKAFILMVCSYICSNFYQVVISCSLCVAAALFGISYLVLGFRMYDSELNYDERFMSKHGCN